MEVQRDWNPHKDQALQYTRALGPVIQCRDMDNERRVEPQTSCVRDDRASLYSRRHPQRPMQKHRYTNGTGCDKRCGEPCSCQATIILWTRRSNAAFSYPEHLAVWTGTRAVSYTHL